MFRQLFIYVNILFFLCFDLSNIYSQETINLQGKIYSVDTLINIDAGPGTHYLKLELKSTSLLHVYFLTFDLSNPNLDFNALMGKDSTVTCENISMMASRHSTTDNYYFAGINGDFYNISNPVGWAINGCISNGDIARLPHKTRPMFGYTTDRIPFVGLMIFTGSLYINDEKYVINGVNNNRGSNNLILYNRLNGKYTHTDASGTEIVIEPIETIKSSVNRKIQYKVISVAVNKGNTFIPTNCYVLSGTGVNQTYLNTLSPNDLISLQLDYKLSNSASLNPSFIGAIGGDRCILENGIVCDNDWSDLHPRTAVGFSSDKNNIYFLVVDGRGVSVGVSTKQLADIMKSAGASDAINLDGGGSSGMYISKLGMMNNCSDGAERAVANGFFAINRAPQDSRVTSFTTLNPKYKLSLYSKIRPIFIGYNQYGTIVNGNLGDVTLFCDPKMGFIDENGYFVATSMGNTFIKATYQNNSFNIPFTVDSSSKFQIRLDSATVDCYKPYKIESYALVEDEKNEINPTLLVWTIADPTVCKIENGIIYALKNGETMIYGHFDTQKDSIFIRSLIPDQYNKIIQDWNTTNTWRAASSTMPDIVLSSTNNQNLKTTFTYNGGRLPSFTLTTNKMFWGIPDTLCFRINTNNLGISKLIFNATTHDQVSARNKEVSNLSSSQENVIHIPVSDFTDVPTDRNIYPIRLNSIKVYLGTNETAKKYEFEINEISSIFSQVSTRFVNTFINPSQLKLYPNPVTNGKCKIKSSNQMGKNVKIEICDLNGRIQQSIVFKSIQSDEIELDVSKLLIGDYIIKYEDSERHQSFILMKR